METYLNSYRKAAALRDAALRLLRMSFIRQSKLPRDKSPLPWPSPPIFHPPDEKFSLRETGYEVVGRGGLEPPTSRLSGVRSNQLSYRPFISGRPRKSLRVLFPSCLFQGLSHPTKAVMRQKRKRNEGGGFPQSFVPLLRRSETIIYGVSIER